MPIRIDVANPASEDDQVLLNVYLSKKGKRPAFSFRQILPGGFPAASLEAQVDFEAQAAAWLRSEEAEEKWRALPQSNGSEPLKEREIICRSALLQRVPNGFLAVVGSAESLKRVIAAAPGTPEGDQGYAVAAPLAELYMWASSRKKKQAAAWGGLVSAVEALGAGVPAAWSRVLAGACPAKPHGMLKALLESPTLVAARKAGECVIVVGQVWKGKEVNVELPGGKRNAGETTLEGALREFKEESGCSDGDIEVVGPPVQFEGTFTGSALVMASPAASHLVATQQGEGSPAVPAEADPSGQ